MATVNRKRVQQIAKLVNAQPHRCFLNSQKGLLTESHVDGELLYVEGYISHIIPIEHAWLYDPITDEIIDVTLNDIGAEHYHAGVTVEWMQLLTLIEHTGGALWYHIDGGLQMQFAFAEALKAL